jgi:Spore coat protein
MEDKCVLENILITEKGVCDLYMHGTIESSTANVNQVFHKILDESLCMQNEIYEKMSQKGWYQTEQAQEQQVQKIKQKYTAGSMG